MNINHDNTLVLPLAIWSQGGKFYMLFPHAECNLSESLQLKAPGLTKDSVLDLLSQLHMLSKAVALIHKMTPSGQEEISEGKYGHHLAPQNPRSSNSRRSAIAPPARRFGASLEPGPGQRRSSTAFHFDLKLENILVFKTLPRGPLRWLVADFGTTRVRALAFGSRTNTAGYGSYASKEEMQGDPIWRAPDWVLQGKASRPYDIWSLGCVFLQVLLWFFELDGGDPDDFQQERLHSPARISDDEEASFWFMRTNIKGDKYVRLRPVVVQRLNLLTSHCEGKPGFDEMVNLIKRMLRIRPQERPKAAIVVDDLDTAYREAKVHLDRNPQAYENPTRERVYYQPSEAQEVQIDTDSAVVSVQGDPDEDYQDQPITPERGRRSSDSMRATPLQHHADSASDTTGTGKHLLPALDTAIPRLRSASMGTVKTPTGVEFPFDPDPPSPSPRGRTNQLLSTQPPVSKEDTQ